MTLPVRIRLDNPLLDLDCDLGSTDDPILLRPHNVQPPALDLVRYAPDGTVEPGGVLSTIALSGADQVDDSFAVPRAEGCGPFGVPDRAVDARLGLPSPAGANSLVLHDAAIATGGFYYPAAFAPDQGARFAEYRHAALR